VRPALDLCRPRDSGATVSNVPDPTTRVLIVEDDGDIRSLFEAGLAMRGFVVETAANGQEALAMMELALMQQAPTLPSVIVADLHMPVMDGWQFLTALADHPHLAAIPIIVLTAADDPTKSAPRPQTMLIKPVTMDDLATAISEAARRRSL
jgi:CheY-like chemotaxis protein